MLFKQHFNLAEMDLILTFYTLLGSFMYLCIVLCNNTSYFMCSSFLSS